MGEDSLVISIIMASITVGFIALLKFAASKFMGVDIVDKVKGVIDRMLFSAFFRP